jgi:hypothetical protein
MINLPWEKKPKYEVDLIVFVVFENFQDFSGRRYQGCLVARCKSKGYYVYYETSD